MRAKVPTRFLPHALVALLLVSSATASAGEQETLAAGQIRQNLFGACFWSPTGGWVVGELGRVFRTEDGGRTWTRFWVSGRRPFFGVSCLGKDQVWVSSTHARVFHSGDGGETWSEMEAPGDRNLLNVAFVSERRGTAIGDFGLLVHTEDGGRTWVEEKLPEDFKIPESALDMGVFPEDVLLYGISFVDEDHGWISGEFGTILVTEDGGRSWRQQASGVETTLFGLHFTDRRHGVAVGIDSVILATEDGGETWRKLASPFRERSYYDVFVSGGVGWIVGGRGTVLVSSDGGKEWREFPTPIQFASEWFRGVGMVEGKGLLVGGAGLVYRVEGATATLLNGPPTVRRGEGRS